MVGRHLSKVQILIVALLIAAAISVPLLRSPDLDKQLALIKKTIGEVPPPPSTRLVLSDDRPGIRSIFLNRDFQSSLTFDDIRIYYSTELQKRGWRMASDHELSYYWRNLGGRELVFCRLPYELTLSYDGKREGAPLVYEYSILWNRNRLCHD
jgi:hypothetical protein